MGNNGRNNEVTMRNNGINNDEQKVIMAVIKVLQWVIMMSK